MEKATPATGMKVLLGLSVLVFLWGVQRLWNTDHGFFSFLIFVFGLFSIPLATVHLWKPTYTSSLVSASIIIICASVVSLIHVVDKRDAPNKIARAEAKAKEKADYRKNGFHCLSGWDGSHRGVEQWLKANLRDPDSYQHINTRITPVDNGKHALVSSYRAKNGFGGYTNGVVIAEVDTDDCRAKIVSNM